MPYLTIIQDDTDGPARFTGPHGTVTCEVNEDVLYVWAKPETKAADWQLARALMGLIADPHHWLKKSPLSGVNYWSISVA